MFRGATSINLDDKGRFAIPAKYRNMLTLDCEGKFVCTIDLKQPCLLLYPVPEWAVIEQRLSNLSSMIPAERRMQRLLLGYAEDCDMDKSGRILLAPALRQHAGFSKKIMLVGQLNKFEIWDEQAWHEQVEADRAAELAEDTQLSERLQDFTL